MTWEMAEYASCESVKTWVWTLGTYTMQGAVELACNPSSSVVNLQGEA